MTTFRLRLPRTFQALENRHFLWLWLGRLATSATMQMSTVAQGWLVYRLTDSAFALGWVGAGWSISSLVLSLPAGAITDRVEKRTLLLWMRVLMGINSLVIAILVSLDLIQVWHLAASSFVTGITFAFLMPAQQSLISDLVDRDTLLNAVSLNSVGMGIMGIVCALLAGVMIESIGVASVYYSMAFLYILAVLTLTKLPLIGARSDSTKSVWGDLIDGTRYLKGSSTLMILLGLGLVRVLFVMPYRTLLPAFAQDNMGFDASGLGALMSATSIGTLISAVILCSRGDMQGKGRILLIAGIVVGVALIAFVGIPIPLVTFAMIALVGAANNYCMVLNNTLLQAHSDSAYRGRVLSVYMMMWGLTPLGTLPAGAIADKIGVPWVVVAQGTLVILLFGLVAWKRRDLQTLD